ncbi:hypothetical protein GOBAR_DD03433 [Gossypium barbadense]|nr:hypothetical protein GOBAR_DD03433 [Gossypium barbadense]
MDMVIFMETAQEFSVVANIWARVVNRIRNRQRLEGEFSNVKEKSEARLVHHRPSKELLIRERESLVLPLVISVLPTKLDCTSTPSPHLSMSLPGAPVWVAMGPFDLRYMNFKCLRPLVKTDLGFDILDPKEAAWRKF